MIKCNIEKSVQPPDVTRLICIMQNNLFSMGSKFFQTIEGKLNRKLFSQRTNYDILCRNFITEVA